MGVCVCAHYFMHGARREAAKDERERARAGEEGEGEGWRVEVSKKRRVRVDHSLNKTPRKMDWRLVLR